MLRPNPQTAELPRSFYEIRSIRDKVDSVFLALKTMSKRDALEEIWFQDLQDARDRLHGLQELVDAEIGAEQDRWRNAIQSLKGGA